MAQGGFHSFGTIYVDGVEMKITEKLIPPQKVSLPVSFEIGNPTEVLFMEYDFSLEEKVIKWCDRQKEVAAERQRALEEAAKLAQEEAERKAREEETARLTREKASSSEDSAKTLGHQESQETEQSESSPSAQSTTPEPEIEQKNGPVHGEIAPKSVTQTESVTSPPLGQPVTSSWVPMAQQVTSYSTPQPMFCGATGGILTPLPAQPSIPQQAAASSASTAFDPKDFESVAQDPFETLELKTLDDMAELNKVLQSVQVPQPPKTVPSSNTYVNSVPNTGVVDYSATSTVTDKFGQTSTYGRANNSVGALSTFQVASIYSPAQVQKSQGPVYTSSVKNIGYPDISLGSGYDRPSDAAVALDSGASSVTFQPQSQANGPTVQSGSQWLNANLHARYTNSSAYDPFYASQNRANVPRPALNNPVSGLQISQVNSTANPSPASGVMSNNFSPSFSSSNQTREHLSTASSYGNPFGTTNWEGPHMQSVQQSAATFNNAPRWEEFYQKSSPDKTPNNHNNNRHGQGLSQFSGSFDGGSKSQSHSRSHTPEPSQNGLRNAKSTSDLAACAGSDDVTFTKASALVTTNSCGVSNQQPVVPNKSVLPPTGTETKNHESSESAVKGPEANPYNNMSIQCKGFVNRISDMGFLRTRVVTAVEKLGQDNKKVLDYLCGVNRLCEKGFKQEDAESALLLLNNDEAKANKYLRLQHMFKEFGFSERQIREGLVKNELDEEKTLDWLTSC